MLLSSQEAELFFKLHRSLMCFVNERLQVVPGIDTPSEFSALPAELRWELRNAFLDEPDLLELFVDANPFDFDDDELAIVRSWQDQVAGKFFIFRYLKKYAVFLSSEEHPTAFGVAALSEPFEDLVGPRLPVWVETVLLPFQGKIVYDGLLSSYNISFGGGMKRMLNDSYKAAKERQGIVTSLPIEDRPPLLSRSPRRRSNESPHERPPKKFEKCCK